MSRDLRDQVWDALAFYDEASGHPVASVPQVAEWLATLCEENKRLERERDEAIEALRVMLNTWTTCYGPKDTIAFRSHNGIAMGVGRIQEKAAQRAAAIVQAGNKEKV